VERNLKDLAYKTVNSKSCQEDDKKGIYFGQNDFWVDT
jgi:hypothetical protein